MNSRIIFVFATVCISLCLGATWNYVDQDWGAIMEGGAVAYPDCDGVRQSPINIVTEDTIHDENLDSGFTFDAMMGLDIPGMSLTNNGHTFQMNVADDADRASLQVQGGDLPNGEKKYLFLQFHYHFGTAEDPGSEHTINGMQYPAEIHFVFLEDGKGADDTDALAVLGFFIDIKDNFYHGGRFGAVLDALDMLMEDGDTDSTSFDDTVALSNMFPMYIQNPMNKFYHYNGSLTTPPCYETVNWYVFEEPLYVNQDQYDKFLGKSDYNGDPMENTFRVVQPMNNRIVYRTKMASDSKSIASVAATTFSLAALSALFYKSL